MKGICHSTAMSSQTLLFLTTCHTRAFILGLNSVPDPVRSSGDSISKTSSSLSWLTVSCVSIVMSLVSYLRENRLDLTMDCY